MIDLDDVFDALDQHDAEQPFAVLGLTPELVGSLSAEQAAAVAAGLGRALQKVHHPDHGGDRERFAAVQEALAEVEDDPAGVRAAYLGLAARPAPVVASRRPVPGSIGRLIAGLLLPERARGTTAAGVTDVRFADDGVGEVRWRVLADRSVMERSGDAHDAGGAPGPWRRLDARRVLGSYSPDDRAGGATPAGLPAAAPVAGLPRVVALEDADGVLVRTVPELREDRPLVVLGGRRTITITAVPDALITGTRERW